MARTKRTTTDHRSTFPIRRMILLDVLLLTTLRLIPNEVLCRRLIHPSAQKRSACRKTPSRRFLPPLQGPHASFLSRFGLVFGPFWTADRAETYFCNRLGDASANFTCTESSEVRLNRSGDQTLEMGL